VTKARDLRRGSLHGSMSATARPTCWPKSASRSWSRGAYEPAWRCLCAGSAAASRAG